MPEVTTDDAQALIHVVVTGNEREREQVELTLKTIQEAAQSLADRPIKCLVDLRKAEVVSPEIAELIRQHQQTMARLGVVRTAEIVVSSMVALQLNRIAHEAGVHERIRRFTAEEEARQWLLHLDYDGAQAGPPSDGK